LGGNNVWIRNSGHDIGYLCDRMDCSAIVTRSGTLFSESSAWRFYWLMVGAVGVEPTTNGLKGRCSATELRPCKAVRTYYTKETYSTSAGCASRRENDSVSAVVPLDSR